MIERRSPTQLDRSAHWARPGTFEGFYRLERDRLARALALTLGDVALAVEATDEAMARTFQRWNRVASYDNPAGWTYRVARNWAVSRLRRRRREHRTNTPPDRATWDREPSDPAIGRAIGALPEHQRSVIVLKYFCDWSIEQIAAALDLRQGTVKSRLHRALAALRDELEVYS